MIVASPVPSLSVFFPAYNDGGTIASLVIQAVHAVLSGRADIATVVAGLMSRPLKRED